jgi:HAD superfamily hydrolase (TIGR01549 family)
VALRAVILDLDDTLIIEEATARASLRSTARLLPDLDPVRVEEVVLGAARAAWRAGPHHRLAVELGIASWEGLWSRFQGCHPCLDGLAAWAPTYRTQAWRAALAELGADGLALAEAMADAYDAAQRAGHPLIDGAREAVEGLSASFRMGLLTNGPSDIQRLKLEGTGLASAFDAVVVSGETGVGKPSPDAFRLVLEGLEVDPSEAVMVGDSWERDVEGALAAGIHPVWISRDRPVPGTNPAVTVVASVGEITEALAELPG